MCKLEPEEFLRVRHISPLLSFLLFSFLPPSLLPLLSFFLSLLTIWKHSCFECQAQQAAHFGPAVWASPLLLLLLLLLLGPFTSFLALALFFQRVLARCRGLLTAAWQMMQRSLEGFCVLLWKPFSCSCKAWRLTVKQELVICIGLHRIEELSTAFLAHLLSFYYSELRYCDMNPWKFCWIYLFLRSFANYFATVEWTLVLCLWSQIHGRHAIAGKQLQAISINSFVVIKYAAIWLSNMFSLWPL